MSAWFEEHHMISTYDKALTCVAGLFAIRCVGPVHITRATSLVRSGPYAVESLPATMEYATKKERLMIQELGARYGCHTCGRGSRLDSFLNWTAEKTKYNADHVPPKCIAKQMRLLGMEVEQRFFPQCQRCSSKQGGICSKNSSNVTKTTLDHAYRSRPHYYIAGALLAGSRILIAPKAEKF